MAKAPALLLPPDYVADATESIKKATSSVSLVCMLVTNDAETDGLIDALNDASVRGVNVEVAADIFTYGELAGHFVPTRYFAKKTRAITEMATRFHKSKVHFYWLGRFSNTPFTGRTHMKWCVVDDIVYSFGGVNLYGQGIRNNDYMFKLNDPALAHTLDDEFERLVRADIGRFSFRSRSFNSTAGTVHIDGGMPLDSVIYRRACTLTEQAASIIYVSQYGPSNRLHRLLKKTDAKLYFNPNTIKNASGLSKIVLRLTHLFTHNITLYKKDQYLHAKFMIFTMQDGKKIAITGSHNFAYGGVLLGTREIALETENPAVIKQLETFYQDHIA